MPAGIALSSLCIYSWVMLTNLIIFKDLSTISPTYVYEGHISSLASYDGHFKPADLP